MALTRKAALRFLRTSSVVLCKLLFVDVVCSFMANWLGYFLFHKGRITPPQSMHGGNKQSQDDMGIQVIICGFPRSGCTSLWRAMDILGFRCLHGGAHLSKPSTANLFIKAITTGAPQDWERLLHNYKAIVDYPATMYYKELMEIYPNAKIILNIRDPKIWYKSFSQTIKKLGDSLVMQVVQPCIVRALSKVPHQKRFLINPGNEEQLIINYKQHVEEVKNNVPSYKLYILEIEKNKGWEPLCNFLQVSIPNVPFPFENKVDSFKARSRGRMQLYSIILVLYLSLILSIIFKISKWIFSM